MVGAPRRQGGVAPSLYLPTVAALTVSALAVARPTSAVVLPIDCALLPGVTTTRLTGAWMLRAPRMSASRLTRSP